MEDVWEELIKSIKKLNNKNTKLHNYDLINKNKNIYARKQCTKSFYYHFEVVPFSNNIIDLHGYNIDDAYIFLKNFILEAYYNNKKKVIVITGKGEKDPSLRVEVRRWLQYTEIENYISSFSSMPSNRGGEGALEVKIKKNRR